MLRQIINFNMDWIYIPSDVNHAFEKNFNDNDFEIISLPHSNKTFPHHYFKEDEYRFVSWYRKHFKIESKYKDKKIIIHFEGVMTIAKVYVNDHFVGEHKGGYTPFEFDISEYLIYGDEENIIAVQVDSREHKDIPPEGFIVDYMLFGGIYRNVWLKILNKEHFLDAFFVVDKLNEEEAQVSIEVSLNIDNSKDYYVISEVFDKNGELCYLGSQHVESDNLIHKFTINKPNLWHPDHPYLYNVILKLIKENELIDEYSFKTGIRKVEFKEDGKFYINGKPLKLRGLNRHQTFPYVGAAMPDRIQRKDADILKFELGLNYVRTSHYPQAVSFLDRCDEIGLLVFEEIPGWQHIGDDEWKRISLQNLEEMILRDRNHPCIFMWGVRINESQDDHEFYIKTNELAHELDRSRPTGGVRYIRDSEKLEDVFTFNDFIYNLEGKIQLPNHNKYMITEYMGHMYPTKSYDNLGKLITHAKLHAMIQDKQYGVPNIAGASGWCAFDYNTTSVFGSGDNICYHGVCDIFRLPKFAAHFYRSQADPKIYGPYIFIASYMLPSFEEENGDKLLIFSNCDEVELFIDNKFIAKKAPNRIDFPNLPHPPFEFSLKEIGVNYFDIRINNSSITAVGILNDQRVVSHKISLYGKPNRILLKADDEIIIADGSDCTRVIISVIDENGSILPYANIPVMFEIQGEGVFIGENPIVLEAGRAAVYIKSTRKQGEIELTAYSNYVPYNETITIKTISIF